MRMCAIEQACRDRRVATGRRALQTHTAISTVITVVAIIVVVVVVVVSDELELVDDLLDVRVVGVGSD